MAATAPPQNTLVPPPLTISQPTPHSQQPLPPVSSQLPSVASGIRADSSNLRAPLTANTLGRRRSSFCHEDEESLSISTTTTVPALTTLVTASLPSALVIDTQPSAVVNTSFSDITTSPLSSSASSTPPPFSTPASRPTNTPSSMFLIFASRFLEWLHVDPKHTRWTTPSSSRRSSMEETVLPISAPPNKESFDLPEPPASSAFASLSSVSNSYFFDFIMLQPSAHLSFLAFIIARSWRSFLWHLAPDTHTPICHSQFHASILMVILLFPLSTTIVLLSLSTLPISVSWPRTLADIAQLGRELHGYAQSGLGPSAHVVGVMSITAVWKHAWSIPGSVVWNVLGGALFSPTYATLLLALLTTIGSLCASMLSKPLAPIMTQFFPRALEVTRHAIEGDNREGGEAAAKSPAWVRLSILRLIGVVPWSGINIACGVCGVAIGDCFLGTFIGSLPWTAVTCQIGDILQTLATTPSPTPRTITSVLTSPEIILKLVFLSFLSLAPILLRDKLRSLISQSASASTSASDTPTVNLHPSSAQTVTDKAAWAWIQEWRTRLRGQPQMRMSTQEQLAILIEEKRTMEDLSS